MANPAPLFIKVSTGNHIRDKSGDLKLISILHIKEARYEPHPPYTASGEPERGIRRLTLIMKDKSINYAFGEDASKGLKALQTAKVGSTKAPSVEKCVD